MSEKPDSIFEVGAFCDAGDQGCASNVLRDIRQQLEKLQPGEYLEIRSTNASLAADLPAWCRLTGNSLVNQKRASDGATCFLVQRKS